MLRLVAISVICVSCSTAVVYHSIDGSFDHDDASVHDSSIIHHDGAGADAPPTIDAPMACKPANIIHGDGKHNAGMDCMSSCHDHGFSVAGTVYAADGITPANNATVTVISTGGAAQDLIVGTNGNFFSYFPVTYPVTISASLCPSTQAMVTQPTTGGCNATGCHEPGGLQGVTHL